MFWWHLTPLTRSFLKPFPPLAFVTSNALDFSITFLLHFLRHLHKQLLLFHPLFKCFVPHLHPPPTGPLDVWILATSSFHSTYFHWVISFTFTSLASPYPGWQFPNLYFQPRFLSRARPHTCYLFNFFISPDISPRSLKTNSEKLNSSSFTCIPLSSTLAPTSYHS